MYTHISLKLFDLHFFVRLILKDKSKASTLLLPRYITAFSYTKKMSGCKQACTRHFVIVYRSIDLTSKDYSMIVATAPDPTVRPPSRIAKLRPCSIAIG